MSNKLGVQETKELLGFVIGLGNALGSSLEDGKVSILDVHKFVAPLLAAGDAFQGAGEIAKELADLSDVERSDLLEFVKKELNLPQDGIESVVETAFSVLAQLHVLVQKIKGAAAVA